MSHARINGSHAISSGRLGPKVRIRLKSHYRCPGAVATANLHIVIYRAAGPLARALRYDRCRRKPKPS